MNIESIRDAKHEAKKLLIRIAAVEKLAATDSMLFYGSRETAALRRQSMELTNALADMRKV